MRIAAVSHSCAVDVNQRVYSELRKHRDVELLLIAPERWSSSLRGLVTFSALPDLSGCAQPLPTRFAGHIHFHSYRGLGPVLARFKPDVLFMDEEPYSLVTSQGLAWRNRLGCKFVFYTKQNLLKRYLPPFSRMQQRVLRAADHAFVVSADAARVLRARGYAGEVTELPHGVDVELLAPRENGDLLERLNVRPPVIGYVGRIAVEKGVWDLLRAVRLLVERRGNTFRVLVVGDGPQRWKLEEAARRRLPPGLLVFTGSVAHHAVPDYLSALDILVLPSRTLPRWKEQFGRVLVEALACGVPLVGSSSGHIPALIEDTGGGLVFREGDAEDMAQKIDALLSDPQAAQAFAERGRARVVEKYSYPRVAETLYATLRRVVGDG